MVVILWMSMEHYIENLVWQYARVINFPSTANEWEVNELGGEDKIFVATNNERDALMIALKYS